MAKGNQAPAKVMSAGNRPNGKAWKKFIRTLVFDERKNRYKMKRIPNPKAK